MKICDNCGGMSISPEYIGDVCLCKFCFSRVNGLKWQRLFISDVNELEKEISELKEITHKKGFAPDVREKLINQLKNQCDEGYICGAKCFHQSIKVYEEKVVITTDDNFNQDYYEQEINKTIKLKNIKNQVFGSNVNAAGYLINKGIGSFAKRTLVGTVASLMEDDQKETPSYVIKPGKYTFMIDEIESHSIIEPSVDGYGKLRFHLNNRNEMAFYFRSSELKEVRFLISEINKRARELYDKKKEKEKEEQQLEQRVISEKERIDAIREYKKLFDEGIITQEEFETKKKELLGVKNEKI